MEVKPTRSELMKLKKKINLAKSGYKLLKKKRDGLILEFFELLKQTKSVRNELIEKYKEAKLKIGLARMLDTDLEIKSLTMSIRDRPVIDVQTNNIMGVLVPKIESDVSTKKFGEHGYGTVTTSIALVEATTSYEELLDYIVKVAEFETGIKKLLVEIDKTKRRVNALEFEVLPKLDKIKNFITLRLEEMERETTFRTKRIKKK
ncbi:V-type ATP synthase subunit D [archaeon]|jgi:V/A-type H+/Na+-transporting ATPase subunit D|nr:V-type ATP synthase subunit D [archaeon]MBT4351599.1 V-type ATP synthase subunit D [archaeon]MBT4648356.1 V-type ATP synthase subunit D [archaeon]MBT6822345.1 V-type ATP synthase subunit D [archaeon]MBT7391593.1 V-type ATP synthase subunit D [archaeon]